MKTRADCGGGGSSFTGAGSGTALIRIMSIDRCTMAETRKPWRWLKRGTARFTSRAPLSRW
jgi:hypothetical protein